MAYQAKGLVVGYVQSGKTANFTGVIAKAIDAGYRLIIVLTGRRTYCERRPSDDWTRSSSARKTCYAASTRTMKSRLPPSTIGARPIGRLRRARSVADRYRPA